MTEAIVRNKERDFFQEIWKLNPKEKITSNLDGQVKSKGIADTFADKFDQLLQLCSTSS